MDPYLKSLSLFRRRKYEQCIEICNELLNNNPSLQGPWELKMRAMTQRVYIDDIEAEEDAVTDDPMDTEILATAPKPGTSLRTATAIKAGQRTASSRPRTSTGRPLTGVARPGTIQQRAGTSSLTGNRTALQSGRGNTARNIRLGSASIFSLSDNTFNMSRLNPSVFAMKSTVAKILFQVLYYHEGDVKKALDLCNAVMELNKTEAGWWWLTQKGRCLIAIGNARLAENSLRSSLKLLPHPDTISLLARAYCRIDQPLAALEVCKIGLEKLPNDISLLKQQGRIYELIGNLPTSVRTYKQIIQLDPMNTEALSCISVHYFYNYQPEMALVYYRRLLSMGLNACELFCNIGLCCLYGGQLDLVFSCFQRALRLAISADQKADVWYNISFIGLNIGDLDFARRCLRICISLDGGHASALNNLGVIAMKKENSTKAKMYFNLSKKLLPENDEIKHNINLIENKH
ncbi:CLUMA_CG013863, isoform A [Clunio marinus]|uniref:CLUMA_CG013863, isoform A n=1 Tax=Clunio marinus TaxID=568069 RepID=A0A1J1IK44_9DIPT|nr:CLUMA_CG013863, isoform A [Clunio marinus]